MFRVRLELKVSIPFIFVFEIKLAFNVYYLDSFKVNVPHPYIYGVISYNLVKVLFNSSNCLKPKANVKSDKILKAVFPSASGLFEP